jgi:hypothetical protein
MKSWVFFLFIFASPAFANTSLWIPVPLVTAANKTAAHPGGEGGQQVQTMSIDTSGNNLFIGTDVGHAYVNHNGGNCCWLPSNIGIKSNGVGSSCFDPNNSNRMIVAGCNSGSTTWGGLYLSTDAGNSWASVLQLTSTNVDLYQNEIAFDPASLSGGNSVTCYYLSDGGASTKALYKSTNSGATWASFNTGACCATGGWIKVAPTGSQVYIVNPAGFWVSSNGGTSFTETVVLTTIKGLDVTPAAPTNVYITENTIGVFKSTTNGSAASFTQLTGTGLVLTGGGLINATVNPLNINDMWVVTAAGSGNEVPYWSVNGGTNWTAAVETTTASFFPANQRNGLVLEGTGNTWSVWTNTVGDFVSQATYNGANTFLWNNDGYSGATLQSINNFSANNPLNMFIATQDYNSATSTDGGNSFTYQNVSGQAFGGFNYGGGAMFVDGTHIFCGNTGTVGNPVTISISANSGVTWGPVAGVTVASTAAIQNVACDDPNNSTTAFWNSYRTQNSGVTWGALPVSVQGIFTFNYKDYKTLYGAAGLATGPLTIVSSVNDGTSFSVAVTESLGVGSIIDIAYDWKNNNYYAATNQGALIEWVNGGAPTNITSRLPVDNAGNQDADTVCIDPLNPTTVYAGWYTGVYSAGKCVYVSYDAGGTWQSLSSVAGDIGVFGGIDAVCLRVNPVTGYLYCGEAVSGMYKYPPPYMRQYSRCLKTGLSKL